MKMCLLNDHKCKKGEGWEKIAQRFSAIHFMKLKINNQ